MTLATHLTIVEAEPSSALSVSLSPSRQAPCVFCTFALVSRTQWLAAFSQTPSQRKVAETQLLLVIIFTFQNLWTDFGASKCLPTWRLASSSK